MRHSLTQTYRLPSCTLQVRILRDPEACTPLIIVGRSLWGIHPGVLISFGILQISEPQLIESDVICNLSCCQSVPLMLVNTVVMLVSEQE